MTSQAPRPPLRVEFPADASTAPNPDQLDGVALVTIDRPEALNALSFGLIAALATELERLDADAACRAVVITGAGTKAFAAGADIRELAAHTTASLRADDPFRDWRRIDRIGLPLIAAVRGYALGGGCELAMACDLIMAADDAVFGQPEIRLGVIPGAGGTQRLPRRIGPAKALELILTGDRLGAADAAEFGLVNRVVPAEEVVAAALDLAGRIAAMPPLAIRAAKAAIRAATELPLTEGLAAERRAFDALFDTADQREGMAAFLEKRPPRWRGA